MMNLRGNIFETSVFKLILLVLLLGIFPSLYAQNGNGYEDPYNVNGYGITGYGRRGNLPLEDISKLSKESQDKIREETLKKTIEKLNTNLHLDELQLIVITNVLTDNQKKQNGILAKEDSQENKITKIEALMETTEHQVLSFLNKDQKENYKLLIEERKNRFEKLKK